MGKEVYSGKDFQVVIEPFFHRQVGLIGQIGRLTTEPFSFTNSDKQVS